MFVACRRVRTFIPRKHSEVIGHGRSIKHPTTSLQGQESHSLRQPRGTRLSGYQNLKRDHRRGLSACAVHHEANGLKGCPEDRRRDLIALHRRNFQAWDTNTVLKTSHLGLNSAISPFDPPAEIFRDTSKKACILGTAAEGETGPYWVRRERIRSSIRENQAVLPVILEQQYIDVETCRPVPNLYAELWGCNATGVYSGPVAEVQMTDAEGVVRFDTLFPGHYDGRTKHYHNVAHFGAQRLTNDTLSGGIVGHVAQIFWDQEIIDTVEGTYPYNTNEIPITSNAVDRVEAQETEYSDSDFDPMVNYVLLGDKVEDRILAWVTVAVNLSAVHYPYYTNVRTAEGAVEVEGTEEGDPRVIDGSLPQMTAV
ncbi:Intradiol ring-cleavage dioxygenase [Aspergillus foveolatus]|uniref:Intradiol ring-cleavage dioxygenase n=1 Tax=Aspergillus foveolatus TaxID=210207 RepID=UPI003CCD887E